MEAGLNNGATQKGRLRSQLLNSEQDINGLGEQQHPMAVQQGHMQQIPQGYPQQYPQQYMQQHGMGPQNYSQPSFLSSYESLQNTGASSGSRKASLTSQSNMSMNKLFKRNKGGSGGFDEDMGADIGDLTNGSNVSFGDISHIRDRGPYGMNGSQNLDTTPFIPTLGAGIGSASGKSMNNIEYRKQMNHQKKLAFASNARAMSLAGSNPMQNSADPRAMSLSSFGNAGGPRTMSLNSQPMANGPRAMSLNNRMPVPPNGNMMPPNGNMMPPNGNMMPPNGSMVPPNGSMMPHNGPRAMPMRNNGPQFGNGPYMQGPPPNGQRSTPGAHGPRAMSLTNGNPINPQFRVPQHMQQQPVQHPTLNPNARAMSLGGNNPNNDPRFNRGPGPHMGPSQGMGPNAVAGNNPGHGQYNNFPNTINNGNNPSLPTPPAQEYLNSNDSLMNVLEEEDENHANSPKENIESSTPRKNIEDKNEDEDVIYKFDDQNDSDAGSLSRVSTLKKSNSMRLRKLNLFNSDNRDYSDIQEDLNNESPNDTRSLADSNHMINGDQSKSFNLENEKPNRESIIQKDDEDYLSQLQENKDKLGTLGATAADNNTNNNQNSDVFVTANNLLTPSKRDNGKAKTQELSTKAPVDDIKNIDEDSFPESTLKGRGSPGPVASLYKSNSQTLSKQPSIKSLVTNTAFNNFRTSSLNNNLPETPDYPDTFKEIDNTKDINLESLSEPQQIKDNTSSIYSASGSERITPNNLNSTESFSTQSIPLASQDSTRKSNSNTSRGDIGDATPPTTKNSHNSNDMNDNVTLPSSTNENYKPPRKAPDNDKRIEGIRNANTSDMLVSPITDDNSFNSGLAKKERRSSKTFSLTNTSKNIFKRLSKSGKKPTDEDDSFNNDDASFISKRNSTASFGPANARKLSSHSIGQVKNEKPLRFTKEELGIMNCNNELLSELQLVTTELASSIRRELAFENNIKNKTHSSVKYNDLESELLRKSKVISDLQEKLNKERNLRFISEEHALLAEDGASPSPLKLNYEKTELYKQLLIKNDLANQLQDKLDEYQIQDKGDHQNLLNKYNDLSSENPDLKVNVIPALEKRIETSKTTNNRTKANKSLNLINNSSNNINEDDYLDDYYHDEEYDQSRDHIEINTLKNQREELREVVTKLTSSYNYELKAAQEKIKKLESKVLDMNSINEKLTKRLNSNRSNNGNNSNDVSSSSLLNNKGGKLQGFAIVSPTKKLFD